MHAFSSTGAAAAVLAGLLDFTRVAVLVLPAAVVANAVWLRLPWIMWLGMVVYTCWALVLLAGVHIRNALCMWAAASWRWP